MKFSNNIIHTKSENAEYIQFKELLENKNVVHAFTCKMQNKDFDFSKDNPNLQENYKNLCDNLNVDYKNIVRPNQTHTDNIICIDKIPQPNDLKNVDGLITNKKNIILATVYADCMPLYFIDIRKDVIALVHSGWRGTIQKIGLKAVLKMQRQYGSNLKDIKCYIGPTIRDCHFEVEDDTKNEFEQVFGKDDKVILNSNNIEVNPVSIQENKYNIDAVYANKKMLMEVGLLGSNIIDSNICTVCNKNKFFSYRATRTQQRMLAIMRTCLEKVI